MHQKSILKAIFLVFSLLAFGTSAGRAAVPAQTALPGQETTVRSQPLQLVDRVVKRKIPPPEAFLRLDSANAAVPSDFSITYTGTWTPEAITAFEYAVSIWSSLIDPVVKITINAHSDSNYAAAYSYITLQRDSPGIPRANTWYPRTLANQFAGYDVLPADNDFEIYYDSVDYVWYFGTDGNPPYTSVDFISAILHEIGHGLGIIGSFSASYYLQVSGRWGLTYNYPEILDTFIVNGAGQSMLDTSLFPNPSPELGLQLISDNVFFDGPMTRQLNQGLRGKMQAKVDSHTNQVEVGDHLDDDFYNGTPNALMTPSLNFGESIHNPGTVTLGMLADLGWALSPNLPVFSPIPSQMMLANTQRINAIDLWEFIPAGQLPGTNFTYAILNTPVASAGVSLHDNRYIDLVPDINWIGSTDVTIRATNLEGVSVSQLFTVSVVKEIHILYLPTIAR